MRVFVLASVLVMPLALMAKDAPQPEPLVVKDIPAFIDYQLALREKLEANVRSFHLKDSARRDLYRAQDKMLQMLRGKNTVEDLNPYERVEVFNLQNEVASILQDAEEDRPICERTSRVGSHLAQVDCRTKHERELDRAISRQELLFPRTCDVSTPQAALPAMYPCGHAN